MTKAEFLERLRVHLSRLPEAEREDILRDQEELIRDALESGRSEEDIIASLGDPKTLGANLVAESRIQKLEDSPSLNVAVRNSFPAILAVLTLAPFNVIFVLGPFLALVGIIFAGWGLSIAGVVTSLSVGAAYFSELIYIPVGSATHLSAGFFLLGVFGLSLLGLSFMIYVTHFFVIGTIRYLKWNLKFVRRLARS